MKKSNAMLGFAAMAVLLVGAGCTTPRAENSMDKKSDALMKEDARMMKDAVLPEQDDMEEKTIMEGGGMEKDMMKQDDSAMMDKEMMKKENGMMTVGTYEVYTPEKLSLAQNGDVVLFFKADWCPSCRAVDADIKANLSAIPSSTHILSVDYDKYADLKKQYGVTYQHTFVQVDASGMQLKKWSGSPTLAALLAEVL